MKYVNASNDKVIVTGTKTSINKTGKWNIYLKKIPTRVGGGKDCTVVLKLDGKELFRSSEKDGITITTTVSEPYGTAKSCNVILDIPVMGTTLNRDFELVNGEHILLEANSQGLAIKQSSTPPS